jgi:hypothetical protein
LRGDDQDQPNDRHDAAVDRRLHLIAPGDSNRGLSCAVRFATRQQLDQFLEGCVACKNSLPR